jgi:hypothetical protein
MTTYEIAARLAFIAGGWIVTIAAVRSITPTSPASPASPTRSRTP